jgi:hypothetical protein
MDVEGWNPEKLWAQWLTVTVVMGGIISPADIHDRRRETSSLFFVPCCFPYN